MNAAQYHSLLLHSSIYGGRKPMDSALLCREDILEAVRRFKAAYGK